MSPELEAFRTALATVVRPAHIPEVTRTVGASTGSRYFGQPWLPEGTAWPEHEGEPLAFVLQLNTAELPAPWGASDGHASLIQFFYASDAGVARFLTLDPTQPGALASPPADHLDLQPALAIAAWHTVPDHPWIEDFDAVFGDQDEAETFSGLTEELGSSTFGEIRGTDGQIYSEAAAIRQQVTPGYHSFECDKLGGWPRWEQGNETPTDSQGHPMTFLFQVGHEGLILGEVADDIDWPIWGRGHLFVSEQTGEFRFGSACD